jgi:hypothetical protein
MLKKFLIACLACLIFCPLPKAPAQYVRVGVDGPIPLGTLDAMEKMLDLADAHQKADLLARLGVDPVIAKNVAEDLLAGEKIELKPLRAKGEADYGVAYLPGGFRVCGYLYLLQGSDEDPVKKAWHVINHQQFDCWDMACSFEILPLRQPDVDDIVVHHVNEGHGSNYLADQTQVFSILNGKLQQTLVTQDHLDEGGVAGSDALEQSSTFLRFPGNALEETRTTTVNDKLKKVERRYWRWSEQKRKFIPGQFRLIVVPSL